MSFQKSSTFFIFHKIYFCLSCLPQNLVCTLFFLSFCAKKDVTDISNINHVFDSVIYVLLHAIQVLGFNNILDPYSFFQKYHADDRLDDIYATTKRIGNCNGKS